MALLTIIGMGSGLNYAIAERFGKEGFTVAMIARRADKLETYRTALGHQGVNARGFVADAADLSQLDAVLAQIDAEMGKTDVLVYSAAALHSTPALEQTTEGLIDDFRVNIAGAFHAARWAFPGMVAQGKGTILLTGGGLAQYPSQAYTSLSLGKAALRNLAFSLAEAVQNTGVHVATVTINGFINPEDAKYSPVLIAEQYWMLYQQAPGEYQTEVSY